MERQLRIGAHALKRSCFSVRCVWWCDPRRGGNCKFEVLCNYIHSDARWCDPRSLLLPGGIDLRASLWAAQTAGTCACLAPMRNSFVVFARRSTPNVGRHDFDFENTTHFACPHQLHLTFACKCPVASARRCGLVILLWHRHNPVRCCELLILQGAQTLHRWRCVCVRQKSGAHAFG